MTYVKPSLSALIEQARLDIETRLPGADARLRHSVLDVIGARVPSGALFGLYGYAEWISRQILPDTADGEYLARHASIWGLARKAARAATGQVTFTGTDGAQVAAGALLVRVDGRQYRTLGPAAIIGGAAVADIEAVEAGTGGAMQAGKTLDLVQLVAGISSTVTIAEPGIADGVEEESDESLLGRLLDRIRTPPQGGSKADYRAWALAQPGVTRAWVLPLWLGEGTVGVTFVIDGRADIIPTPAEVAAVQSAIDALRPVTAEAIVFAPTPRPIDIQLASAPASDAVHAAIAAELADLFVRDAEPGGTIRRSRIGEAISIAAGEDYHELTSPAGDIALAPGELPMLGNLIWG